MPGAAQPSRSAAPAGVRYHEAEVNAVLRDYLDDYPMLCRSATDLAGDPVGHCCAVVAGDLGVGG